MLGDRGGIQSSTGICWMLQVLLDSNYLVSHWLATLLLLSRYFILFISALRKRIMKLCGIS